MKLINGYSAENRDIQFLLVVVLLLVILFIKDGLVGWWDRGCEV